jgi:hypothetical protein
MNFRNGYYINFLDGTIYFTKEFYQLAQNEDSWEGDIYETILHDYCGMKIVVL